MGILQDKFFKEVEPFFLVEAYGREKLASSGGKKPRVRIEMAAMPPKLLKKALRFTMPCVRCGAAIHPFRYRAKTQRGNTGRVYYACTCPLDVNVGCSRGRAATDEYDSVRLYFGK